MHKSLAQMRNVFEKHHRMPKSDVVEQHQVLMNLTHIANVRHNRQPELARKQADREELADSRHPRAIHLHKMHRVFAYEVLEQHSIGNVFAERDAEWRYPRG